MPTAKYASISFDQPSQPYCTGWLLLIGLESFVFEMIINPCSQFVNELISVGRPSSLSSQFFRDTSAETNALNPGIRKEEASTGAVRE